MKQIVHWLLLLLMSIVVPIMGSLTADTICSDRCLEISSSDECSQQSSMCNSIQSTCDISFDCESLETQNDCKTNTICKWSQIIDEEQCKNNKTLQTMCLKKSEDVSCNKVSDKCTWDNGGKYIGCTLQQDACSVKSSEEACSSDFCLSDFVCTSKTVTNCGNLSTYTTCSNDTTCSWDNDKLQCIDLCSTLKKTTDCTGNTTCKTKTPYSKCIDYAPIDSPCQLLTSDDSCNTSFCSKQVEPEACLDNKDDYNMMSDDDDDECTKNVSNYDYIAIQYGCININSSSTCNSKELNTCSQTSGCKQTGFSCQNIISCNENDDESNCKNPENYCSFKSVFIIGNVNNSTNSFQNILYTGFTFLTFLNL